MLPQPVANLDCVFAACSLFSDGDHVMHYPVLPISLEALLDDL